MDASVQRCGGHNHRHRVRRLWSGRGNAAARVWPPGLRPVRGRGSGRRPDRRLYAAGGRALHVYGRRPRAEGSYSFSGVLLDANRVEQAVGGDSSIRVGPAPTPTPELTATSTRTPRQRPLRNPRPSLPPRPSRGSLRRRPQRCLSLRSPLPHRLPRHRLLSRNLKKARQ